MSLRDDMPQTAAFIDAMRDAFGAEHIDAQIRKGMNGKPGFYAEENGHTFGTPMPDDSRPHLNSEQFLKLGKIQDVCERDKSKGVFRGRK